MDPGLVEGRVEAKAVRDLVVGRVAEDGGPAADQDGHVRHPDLEAVEQLLGLRALVQVHVGVRVGVALAQMVEERARLIMEVGIDDMHEESPKVVQP